MTSVALHSYPSDCSLAFAFSSLLYPLAHQRSLRFACPWGEQSGLPCSDASTEWPGSFFTPRTTVVCVLPKQTGYTGSYRFCPQPVSIFGWTGTHDAYKGSLALTILHSSQAQLSAQCSQISPCLTTRLRSYDRGTFSPELRTRPLPATRVQVGYCWQNSRFRYR